MKQPCFVAEAAAASRAAKRTLNVIFLDIDGVLYGGRACKDAHQANMANPDFDPKNDPKIIAAVNNPDLLKSMEDYDISALLNFSKEAVRNLCKLCEDYNAKIVISSSWRTSSYDKLKSLDELKAWFSIPGFSQYIIGATPVLTCGKSRGDEIEAWLLEHADEINSFIILDDVTFNILKLFPKQFVHCKQLLADEATYQQAKEALSKPCQFEQSETVLQWNAIAINAKLVTTISLNLEKITILKLHFGIKKMTELLDRLLLALKDNTHITHFELTGIKHEDDVKKLSEIMTIWLRKSKPKLNYLDLSHNNLSHITPILLALDGINLHVPHINLNANPAKDMEALAKWIEKYPKDLRLDLDFSDNGSGRYMISNAVINAILRNLKITISTCSDAFTDPQEKHFISKYNYVYEHEHYPDVPTIEDPRVLQLQDEKRLTIQKPSRENGCCLS